MTSQEVIKFGQQIIEPVEQNFNTSFYFVITIFLGVCIFVLLVNSLLSKENVVFFWSSIAIALFIWLFLFFFYECNREAEVEYRESEVEYRMKINQWTEEIAYPYIESLPTMERELDTVILDTQMVKGKTYTNELPLIISYTEKGKTITTSATYEIEKRLKDGEKPVLEYKRLNSELGHDVTKGDYFLKIILPKNFKLEPSSN
jgi:hypothetical protein